MATYIEIIQHPTLSDRIKIITNALAPIKNYKTLNPLKSQIWDYRVCNDNIIEILMEDSANYAICALPLYNPSTMMGTYPIEIINGVTVADNDELLTQLEILLIT